MKKLCGFRNVFLVLGKFKNRKPLTEEEEAISGPTLHKLKSARDLSHIKEEKRDDLRRQLSVFQKFLEELWRRQESVRQRTDGQRTESLGKQTRNERLEESFTSEREERGEVL